MLPMSCLEDRSSMGTPLSRCLHMACSAAMRLSSPYTKTIWPASWWTSNLVTISPIWLRYVGLRRLLFLIVHTYIWVAYGMDQSKNKHLCCNKIGLCAQDKDTILRFDTFSSRETGVKLQFWNLEWQSLWFCSCYLYETIPTSMQGSKIFVELKVPTIGPHT